MGKIFNAELFAKRLSALMQKYGDSTYSLGDYLDMSPSTISKYTTGVSVPKSIIIEKIATKYNINPVWLMGCETVSESLPDKNISKEIPVLGVIAAGAPIYAEEHKVGIEYVDSKMDIDFCLKVKGDSMINARIFDGDIVFIRRQPDVDNGDIAVVLVDGENATLKRVYKTGNTLILRPENPTYNDLVISGKDLKQVTILGKCIAAKIWLTN